MVGAEGFTAQPPALTGAGIGALNHQRPTFLTLDTLPQIC